MNNNVLQNSDIVVEEEEAEVFNFNEIGTGF